MKLTRLSYCLSGVAVLLLCEADKSQPNVATSHKDESIRGSEFEHKEESHHEHHERNHERNHQEFYRKLSSLPAVEQAKVLESLNQDKLSSGIFDISGILNKISDLSKEEDDGSSTLAGQLLPQSSGGSRLFQDSRPSGNGPSQEGSTSFAGSFDQNSIERLRSAVSDTLNQIPIIGDITKQLTAYMMENPGQVEQQKRKLQNDMFGGFESLGSFGSNPFGGSSSSNNQGGALNLFPSAGFSDSGFSSSLGDTSGFPAFNGGAAPSPFASGGSSSLFPSLNNDNSGAVFPAFSNEGGGLGSSTGSNNPILQTLIGAAVTPDGKLNFLGQQAINAMGVSGMAAGIPELQSALSGTSAAIDPSTGALTNDVQSGLQKLGITAQYPSDLVDYAIQRRMPTSQALSVFGVSAPISRRRRRRLQAAGPPGYSNSPFGGIERAFTQFTNAISELGGQGVGSSNGANNILGNILPSSSGSPQFSPFASGSNNLLGGSSSYGLPPSLSPFALNSALATLGGNPLGGLTMALNGLTGPLGVLTNPLGMPRMLGDSTIARRDDGLQPIGDSTVSRLPMSQGPMVPPERREVKMDSPMSRTDRFRKGLGIRKMYDTMYDDDYWSSDEFEGPDYINDESYERFMSPYDVRRRRLSEEPETSRRLDLGDFIEDLIEGDFDFLDRDRRRHNGRGDDYWRDFDDGRYIGGRGGRQRGYYPPAYAPPMYYPPGGYYDSPYYGW